MLTSLAGETRTQGWLKRLSDLAGTILKSHDD